LYCSGLVSLLSLVSIRVRSDLECCRILIVALIFGLPGLVEFEALSLHFIDGHLEQGERNVILPATEIARCLDSPDKGAVRREVRTADDKAPVVFLSVELLHIADGLGG